MARLKQTRQNYQTYVDRVSEEEQKQKLPCISTNLAL